MGFWSSALEKVPVKPVFSPSGSFLRKLRGVGTASCSDDGLEKVMCRVLIRGCVSLARCSRAVVTAWMGNTETTRGYVDQLING
jgi:hypothetical protein